MKQLLLVLTFIGLFWLIYGSQDYIPGNNCLYVSRQMDSQVLIYSDYSVDEHGLHYDPIGTVEGVNANPTGIASMGHLVYIGSYGKLGAIDKGPNIQIFDTTRNNKLIGDFLTTVPEIAQCFPESLVYHRGYLYVACGVVGKGVLQIDTDKKVLKAVLATEIPLIWGLAARDHYLYVSSHCHDEDIAGEGVIGFCEKEKHDKIFRIDLNDETKKPEVFASYELEHEAGFADIALATDGTLLAVSFHRNAIYKYSPEGEFVSKLKIKHLEFPIGITIRDDIAYIPSPGRGEIHSYDINKAKQELHAHSGPLLNSKLSYLVYARCPIREKDEL